MFFTVQDLLSFDSFKGLRLVTGAGGLHKPISGCGILDYETDASLKGKYLYSSFLPNQIVLTSLLFAKNNPFQIADAIKYLISRQASGLIIKNIFHLPIHDTVLRYADAKDFPIFLLDDVHVYFEDIIIHIDRCIQAATNADAAEEQLNRLRYQKMAADEKRLIARQLLPTFRGQYLMISVQTIDPITQALLQKLSQIAGDLFPEDVSWRIFRYGHGIILIFSHDALSNAPEELCAAVQTLGTHLFHPAIGISEIHFVLEEIDEAIRQAVYAAMVHQLELHNPMAAQSPLLHYRDIGVYQMLLPLLSHEAVQQYSRRILEPLIEFDAENRVSLLATLQSFVQCGGDLHLLAQHGGQHENTLRNRLDKVRLLTGLNYKKPAHYEELALAVQISILQNSGL